MINYMNNDYSQQYPQMYNAMYSPYQQQQYTTGGEDFKRVTTTTRKNTQPVVVSREDLINALKTGTNDYKKALAENNTLAAALGKSISDKEVENTLAAPTNKGRLESEISPLQAFAGGTLAGFNTYGKMSQNAEDTAAKQYDATIKGISTEDALLSKQEAADLQNALNNQTIEVEGYEKYKLPKDGSGSGQQALQQVQILDNMRQDLENIGTKFDEDFKNIDEMQKDSSRLGRLFTNAGWGIGTTDAEKQARDDFEAWKNSMKNVLVNANRQAGTGSMSDADADRFEQKIGKAKNPAEARNILDSFQARLMQTPVEHLRNYYNKSNQFKLEDYGVKVIKQ